MCVTTEVPTGFGLMKMKNRADKQKKLMEGFSAEGNQWLPSQSRNAQYLSRLECMQSAISLQLEEIQAQFPNKKVALIAFNDDVVIIGDGKEQPKIIGGDRLEKYEELFRSGSEYKLDSIRTVSDSKKILTEKILDLSEGGQTALGPALLVAVGLASQQTRRSEIILCTDGSSNKGLGSLDSTTSSTKPATKTTTPIAKKKITVDSNKEKKCSKCSFVLSSEFTFCPKCATRVEEQTEEEEEEETSTPKSSLISTNGEGFYLQVAQLAKKHGIAISVLGIEDSDCSISSLGVLADVTSGSVHVVKPMELQRKMRAIIDNPVIATQTQVKLFLPTSFDWISSFSTTSTATATPTPSSFAHRVLLDLGNVTNEMDISFEFQFNNNKVGGNNNEKSIAIQAQIFYTKSDGMKAVRVISERRPLMNEISQAYYKSADNAVIALNSMQRCAQMALQSKFDDAFLYLNSVGRLLQKCQFTNRQIEEAAQWKTYPVSSELFQAMKGVVRSKQSKLSDQQAKSVFNAKSSQLSFFLAGERKMVSKRKKHVGKGYAYDLVA